MPSLTINGRVSYADLLPAENVSIKISDLDLGVGPGGSPDLIFDRVTGAEGKFSGTSLEWADGPIPSLDILNLKFDVRLGTHSHQGPFVRVGNNSLPIILPPNFPKPVEREARELIQIVHLVQAGYNAQERALYSFIESGSTGLVNAALGDDYGHVHHLEGNNATLEKLEQKLREAGNRVSTKAIDLIFCTHGHTSRVVFADGVKRVEEVVTALADIPQNIRNKFRMVFSTACFGDTHADMWLAAGFTCVSGSEGIYADSEVSLFPFLHSWETGNTFRGAVTIANAADIGNVADNAAKRYYISQGRAADASDINSNRVVSGNGRLRIYSKPR